MSWLGAPDSPPTLRQRARPAGGDPDNDGGPSTSLTRPRRRAAKTTAPANSLVTEAFRMFGEHCARNQIRTLLIDCLVMTNLFYPCFAAFLERRFDAAAASGPARAPTPGSPMPHPSPLAIFTSPLRETFFPDPPPLLPNVPWGPWWARERRGDTPWAAEGDAGAVQAVDGAVDVDVLRVAWADVGHVLDGVARAPWGPRDKEIASAVRALAEDDWSTSGAVCVRHLARNNGSVTASASGPCYLLAPDDVQLPGVTPLSALWNVADHTDFVYRGLAVPFHVRGAARPAFEAEWSARLADKLKPLGAEVFTETYAQGSVLGNATRVAYSDDPVEPVALGLYASYLRQAAYVLYPILLVGLLSQLSNASKVHSRFGLAFTGVVQLCCSAVMSFSVLALLGWNGWGWSKGQTVLPTYVLPFVIIIVGADSMSTLTKAVFSIPFNYSVPVRIGLALSKVGSTIAVTSLTDLALLGVGWLCFRNFQVLREFCVFAAVVIVTDWFMLHTFFLTVLSIDAQRLELADVLATNRELSNAEALKREEEAARRKANRPARFSWSSVLRARTVKSGSLIIILITITGLYYLSEGSNQTPTMTAAASWYGYQPTTTSAYASPTATVVADLSSLSVSEALWRSLNPRGLASIWIGIPRSSIAILPRAGHSMLPADIRRLTVPPWTMRFPSLRPLCHFAKVIIIPQAATAFALYGLLLYLLKDSDLLASQRSSIERETNASDDESDDGGGTQTNSGVQQPIGFGGKVPTAAHIGVFMLPASHASDIDVIAASADGRLAISVGVDNSICLWRFTGEDQCAGTREMVPTALGGGDHPGGPIVAAAVSRDKLWVAVATQYGHIEFWRTPGHATTESVGVTEMACEGARVLNVLFDDARPLFDDPFTASPVTPTSASEHPPLLVTLTNGGVCTVTGAGKVVNEIPSVAPDRLHHVDVFVSDECLDVIVRRAGSTTVWSRQHGAWSSVPLVSSLDEADRVLAVGHATTTWRGVPVRLVALGHRSGNVEVIDTDGELVTLLALGNSPIRAVAIGAPPTTRCTSCDIQSTEGFYVIASTATTVFIDRIVSRNGGPFCRCAPARRAAALEDAKQLIRASVVFPPMPVRTRALSNGFANGVAPAPPASLAPPTTPADFPVSSHGGRRLSGRRGDDGSGSASAVSTPVRADPGRPPSPMPLDRTNSASGLHLLGTMTVEEPAPAALGPDSRWADAGILALGGVQATEGDWAIVDNVVLGVLRASAGIDDSQWQLWALDLSAPWNGFILMAEAVSLDTVERLSRAAPRASRGAAAAASSAPEPGEQSMRARRAERMLSLNGRASFPGTSSSFTVPTHAPLGYVAVRPFVPAGRSALAGFGNRVGVLALPRRMARTSPPTPAGNAGTSVSAPPAASAPTSTNATPTSVAPPPLPLATPSRQRNGYSAAGLSPQPLPPPPPPPRRSIDHLPNVNAL